MPDYTQANRPLRVTTPLGEDVLLLAGFSGLEGVSLPFSFRLDLLSEDAAVTAGALLRQPVSITLRLPEGEERTLHGLVRRFVQQGRVEELTAYQAEVVPWLWFLSLSRESRIYQNLSALEIVEQVFRALGFADFELRCVKSYPKREYCVQYRETHLDFVSRLMEEEGIFYFFEHSADRHLLVLADANSAVKPCPEQPRARMAPQAADGEDVVTSLHVEETAVIGKVVLKDYDFLQPSLTLESTIAAAEPEEVYDYPGEFAAPEEGERRARIRLEAAGARRQLVRGQGSCRAFASGFRFDLAEHYRENANQAYMLLQVQHTASAGDYRSWDAAPVDYRNQFIAIPHSVAFRPPRVTPHPVVQGTQTALVVGPAGEEVWVDGHGRIKVQFYWDRVGRKDENSSCWMRVAQPWAGKGYGAIQIPRIGSEVVVEFLEGDPDRPLVTGCVYNADQTPPFTLPGAGIQMGMKSRSSKGGGGYNEITMTDTKGKEMMNIHAQYDMVTKVEHDDTQTVVNDRTITVKTGNRKLAVETGTSTENIKGDRMVNVTDGKQSNTVKNAIEITSETSSVHVKASTEIKLEVGSSTLLMKSDGTIELNGVNISVKGTAVAVDGSAKVGIHGGMVSSEADSTHNTKGAMVLSDGSVSNTVRGVVVMLNP